MAMGGNAVLVANADTGVPPLVYCCIWSPLPINIQQVVRIVGATDANRAALSWGTADKVIGSIWV